MNTSTIVWIIVIVVVVLLAIAIIFALTKGRRAAKERKAAELRERAQQQGIGVQQSDLDARSSRAEARKVKAEADQRNAEAERQAAEAEQRAAEAERLEATAAEKEAKLAERREEQLQTERAAEKLSPSGNTPPDWQQGSGSDRTVGTGTTAAGSGAGGSGAAGSGAGDWNADSNAADRSTGLTGGSGERATARHAEPTAEPGAGSTAGPYSHQPDSTGAPQDDRDADPNAATDSGIAGDRPVDHSVEPSGDRPFDPPQSGVANPDRPQR